MTTSPPGLTLFQGAGGLPEWARRISGQQILTLCRRAEAAGVDYIVVPWHVAVRAGEWEQNMGPRWPNPLAASGAIIGATERIGVMPLAVVPCVDPIDLAKGLATLDWLSGGRCAPVLLAGYIKWEFELLGADFDRRDDVTDDASLAMQTLWSGGRSFSSRHVSFDDVVFEPRPESGRLPLWFGGGSKRSLRRIAAMGDGWLSAVIPHGDIPAAIEYICSQPEWQARSSSLCVSAYFVEATYERYSHKLVKPPEVGVGTQWVIERAENLAALGVDMTTAPLAACPTVGIPGKGQPLAEDTFDDYLRRIDWLGEEVIPQTSRIVTTIVGSRRRGVSQGNVPID